ACSSASDTTMCVVPDEFANPRTTCKTFNSAYSIYCRDSQKRSRLVPASFFIDQQGKFAAWGSYGRFAKLEANRKTAVGQIKALDNRLSVSVGLLSWNDYQGNIPRRVLPYLYMFQELERGVMPTKNQGSERY